MTARFHFHEMPDPGTNLRPAVLVWAGIGFAAVDDIRAGIGPRYDHLQHLPPALCGALGLLSLMLGVLTVDSAVARLRLARTVAGS